MNICKIKSKPFYHMDCELMLRDDFKNLSHWAATFPSTITTNTSGAKLSMQIANKKGYICPSIISHSPITYGNVSVTINPNLHPKLSNNFSLRNHSMEWGFKITENHITIIFPLGSTKRKLFNPMANHKLNIDFDAKTNKIFWRVDDVVVYEMPDKITVPKHAVISLHTIGDKFIAKELPQFVIVKSANINVYNIENDKIK